MGKVLIVRVKEKGAKGDQCYQYKNSVNINDPTLIALVFNDLKSMFNAPIKKAAELILKKEKTFPFI